VAADTLRRAAFLGLALGSLACGNKQDSQPPVDLAANRARRDSLARAAVQDSTLRARFTACSDSVVQVLSRSAEGKRRIAAAPQGMIQPEVIQACGNPPAPKPAQVAAKPDTAKPAAGKPATRPDTTKPAAAAPAKPATATPAKPDTAKPAAPATATKPALTPQQQQVMRADSIRQARERARQDSLRQAAERARQDSVRRAQADSIRADSLRLARETEVLRETFTYSGGARDPFVSLITQDKIGPEFGDLLLVGVYLDQRRASNSIAVLRDKTTQKRWSLRVGDRLGRLKVAQIRQSDVVFTVEDIGFERQETLSLRKREEQTP
jgi:hypothetical protein